MLVAKLIMFPSMLREDMKNSVFASVSATFFMTLMMVADRVIGGYPVCVKPAHGGSAQGVHKVKIQEELGEAVLDALSYDEAVNIEQWVDGVELSVSILGTGWDAHALPPVEIVGREGFYDAAARMADDAV
ncbi:hypothetical protein NE591_13050, partial [Adlercreutzia sp. DFI.6.23]|nr:hypothetical protein [Adlercreutzia sp. DFI.6.23]